MSDGVTCIAVEPPPSGTAAAVVPGIHWLRMPLPFKLDHINLWLLEDDDGWTVVDTGISRDTVKQAWEEVFSGTLDGKPVKRVIVTHYHPDHMGLAGWLTRRFGVALSMTSSEWAFAHLACLNSSESFLDAAREFYRSAGFDDALLQAVERSRGTYPSSVSPVPVSSSRPSSRSFPRDSSAASFYLNAGCSTMSSTVASCASISSPPCACSPINLYLNEL